MKVLVTVFAVLVSFQTAAEACMCMKRLSPAEAYEKSVVAAAVKVKAVETSSVTYKTESEERQIQARKYVMETLKMYKGDSTKPLEIFSRQTSCMVKLEEGKEYLVYVNESNSGVLEIATCNRVIPSENAQSDLQFLNSVK